jgi:hypothetical protein
MIKARREDQSDLEAMPTARVREKKGSSPHLKALMMKNLMMDARKCHCYIVS